MIDDTNFDQSQKLNPDAEIVLFEVITRTGTSVFLKSGPPVTYLGDTYESVPVSLSSETRSAESSDERPTFVLGGDELDLSALKPALFSGEVDGGTLIKHVVLLEDLKANNNVKVTSIYRIKQIQDYTKYKVSMIVARFSPSAQTTVPYRKYNRPAYPYVNI